MESEKIILAGKIAKQVKEFARSFVKKEMLLLEIAEKIEDKIFGLGGKPAFPVNLSINEIAAHYTPSYDDKTKSHGLLKIDLGVHVDGNIADTAFSIDLENSSENKKLILASEKALENAKKIFKEKILVSEVGKEIQKQISNFGFSPVVNLSGHSMEKYDLHSGITVPNIDDKREIKIEKGLYAIEPFATNGSGKIHNGLSSGIYQLVEYKNTRSPNARNLLEFIESEYKTLPFCSRWLVKKFGIKILFALRELEKNEIIYQYPQLVEVAGSKVSQAEDTILVDKEKKIVTTE